MKKTGWNKSNWVSLMPNGIGQVKPNHYLDMAKIVQDSLLPSHFAVPGEYEIVAWSRMTSSVGGDYCDSFTLDAARTVFLLGDVSGHGVSAALVMAMAKARVFSHFDEGGTQEGLMEKLNSLLFALTSNRQLMTFCFVIVDFSRHEGIATLAGNPYPVFYRHSDASTQFLGHSAYPLATRANQVYEPVRFTFAEQDFLLMYTDGVVEAINSKQEPFSYERLASLVKTHAHLGVEGFLEILKLDLGKHLGDLQPLDDITVLALSRRLNPALHPPSGGPV
mgnify:FL=1